MEPRREENTSIPRRDFLKQSVVTVGAVGAVGGAEGDAVAAQGVQAPTGGTASAGAMAAPTSGRSKYNTVHTGDRLEQVAFPLGGIGAGMICLEGTGAFSHVSLRNQPDILNEPCIFAAICVKGKDGNVARVLEGPVPRRKIFGPPGTGNGGKGKTYGLPRFDQASFQARFPFAAVTLEDSKIPLAVEITGWSPFVPGDPDASSLPVAGLEYRFVNRSDQAVEAVFSFNAAHFMAIHRSEGAPSVRSTAGGFVLFQEGPADAPWEQGAFSASVTDPEAKVNHVWFRGGWFDSLTMAWKDVQNGACYDRPPVSRGRPAPGGSLFVPLQLGPGQSKTVTLQLAWYVGKTDIRQGKEPAPDTKVDLKIASSTYQPWYSGRFADVEEVATHWRKHYRPLREQSRQFSDCFYDTTLPPEVVEAIAANLTILKSPTVLRQADGRLWCWEGCTDNRGCCSGSCTHVWNYAQAICHLFPSLERTLRETEFKVSQDEAGHQIFRSALPIRPTVHSFHAASDGQLGGIMKVHREWRISGDQQWLRQIWPEVKKSLGFCIEKWDPEHKGVLVEPHHNTYDIEFWGPDGMCTSFYLGALSAAVAMGKALNEDVSMYGDLLEKGRKYLEQELFNGEYIEQKIQWDNLRAKNPLDEAKNLPSEEADRLRQEGPKYQYGKGCLSDGVLGAWIAGVCGVGQILDPAKVGSHLKAVHKYNLKRDLSQHANPQRPTYALGSEGGLLLCTWPRGGALSLPFVYSNEVWTGIEYQVAAHLMMEGMVEEGLEIVRVCRDRYDGRVRNPFNEYECGHWYARAMASYGLLQGLTGIRYDAVDKTLYIQPSIKGDFRSFLATATGYATVGVKGGKPFVEVKSGTIDIRTTKYEAKA